VRLTPWDQLADDKNLQAIKSRKSGIGNRG
jgi:hypothetical protein